MLRGEPLSDRQVDSIAQALDAANLASALTVVVYVGALSGRQGAVDLLATLPEQKSSVLVAVDPSAHLLEIVTGEQARYALDDRSCGLAAVAMTSAFAQGDLVGGLVRGINIIGSHGHRAPVLHDNQP